MVNDFLTGLQIFDLSPGAMSTKNCESDFGPLVFTHERSAKVGLCKTAPAKHGSTFLQLHYKQQASKQNMAPTP